MAASAEPLHSDYTKMQIALYNEMCNQIVLAIGLIFEKFRSISAIGIIILLILVFPANVRHLELSVKKRKNVIPTVLRLPIQGLLIYWAYLFI